MFCSNCGKPTADGETLCADCGGVRKESPVAPPPVIPPPPRPPVPTKAPLDKKTKLLLCGTCLALLVVLAIYLGPIRSFQHRQAEASFAQQTLDEAEKLYTQAETDAALGDYEEALIGATKVLDANPEHEEAQSLVTTLRPKVVISSIDYAKSYQVQGDYPAALEKLNGALALDPTNAEALALYTEIDALNQQALEAAATPAVPEVTPAPPVATPALPETTPAPPVATPAPPEVTPQAATPSAEVAAPEDDQIHWTAQEQTEINLFLSNFSETNFGIDGSNGAIRDFTQAELLRFVLSHNKINAPDSIGYDDGYSVLPDGVVDGALDRFFGLGMTHGSVGEFLHENGNYYTPAADGEFFQYYTVATYCAPTETGSIWANFKIYAVNQNDSFDYSRYYAYTEAQADADTDCAVQYDGAAELVPVVYNGKNTYQLVDYNIYW